MQAGAVILAAGAATRMGQVKQLLLYRGHSLVERTILEAQQAGFAPIVVVLGAQAEAVGEAVARTSADSVVNENWRIGMGSSITCGVARMLDVAADVEAIAILLTDQPYVGASELRKMKQAFQTSAAPMMAASYAGTLGVPAIFRKSVYSKLRSLAPDAGARLLLRGGSADVDSYELPEAATDVDTPDDFAGLV